MSFERRRRLKDLYAGKRYEQGVTMLSGEASISCVTRFKYRPARAIQNRPEAAFLAGVRWRVASRKEPLQ